MEIAALIHLYTDELIDTFEDVSFPLAVPREGANRILRDHLSDFLNSLEVLTDAVHSLNGYDVRG